MNNCFAPLFAKRQMDELMKQRNVQLLLQRLYFLVFSIQAVAVIELFGKIAKDKHDNYGFSENNDTNLT